jgi:hypothetical protein
MLVLSAVPVVGASDFVKRSKAVSISVVYLRHIRVCTLILKHQRVSP